MQQTARHWIIIPYASKSCAFLSRKSQFEILKATPEWTEREKMSAEKSDKTKTHFICEQNSSDLSERLKKIRHNWEKNSPKEKKSKREKKNRANINRRMSFIRHQWIRIKSAIHLTIWRWKNVSNQTIS